MKVRTQRRLRSTALVAILLSALLAPTASQTITPAAVESVHGADGVFVSADLAIIWAVLKESGPANDKASVWLRIVNRSGAFSQLSIDGVDPFTNTRTRLESGVALTQELRLAADRALFSRLPSRELHFYRTHADLQADRPALNVYYLGVPDTTPEFKTKAAMDAYLDSARLVAHPVEKKR
mgnify:CR=1 FL=1